MRARTTGLLAAALLLAACGGSREKAMAADTTGTTGNAMAAGAGTMTMPTWMTVDNGAKTVSLQIAAGETADNNHWNFNGYDNGNATITVPVGYTVTVTFQNQDPALGHSFAILEKTGDWPATFGNPTPVFSGAITPNATDATAGTRPGSSETVSFTADKAGEYALVCVIPAHAAGGMWLHFNVSDEGAVGLNQGGGM